MNQSDQGSGTALTVGLAIALLVVILSFMGLMSSFVKPLLELPDLHRIADLTRRAGFCILLGYLAVGFVLTAAHVPMRVRIKSWERNALNMILALCFLVIILSPYSYVYPEANGWVTKSKSGTFKISEEKAKDYLWRDVRMWSTIPLGLSLLVIFFVRDIGRVNVGGSRVRQKLES